MSESSQTLPFTQLFKLEGKIIINCYLVGMLCRQNVAGHDFLFLFFFFLSNTGSILLISILQAFEKTLFQRPCMEVTCLSQAFAA